MTDTRDHDVELERRIRRHVERAVRPFEAGEVALAAVQTAHPSLRRSRGEFTRRAMVLMIVVVLTVLLIGAVAGGWWRAEQLTPILPSVVAASPSVSASAELTIADALGAEWIADVDDLPEAGVAAGLSGWSSTPAVERCMCSSVIPRSMSWAAVSTRPGRTSSG